VLDIGCGDGAFLRRLVAAGWTGPVHGFEPGHAAAERARARGLVIEEKTFEQLDAEAEFDLIVMRHVIEHVREPRAVLDRVHRALKGGGLAYIATPDERALSARLFGRYWHGYDPPRHLWVFRPDGIRRLLEEAGFDVVEERWAFAPDIFTGSLGYAISPVPTRKRLLTSNFNPLVAIPAAAAGGVEVASRRSTMYGAIARAR
jgi:SAM-dependent methyltransferase